MRSGSISTHIYRAMLRRIPVLAAALLFALPIARSQEPTRPSWALVTLSRRGQDTHAASAAVRERLERAGVALTPSAEMSALLEERDSTDATPIAASDIERWASRSRAALRFLSRGDYAEARQALLEAQAISERAAEALNRETLRARQVLDTCLFVVRASLETGDVPGAEEQARRCRRLVPRMQASAYTHTPEVRELVTRVDAQLAEEATGSLAISSDPAGCAVRINGVYFGQTPLSTSDLPRGEYRVQVECDENFAGRVHRVRLADEDSRLAVRASFDRALRSRPELALVYGTDEESDALADAAAVARLLGRPVLAAEALDDRLTLVAIDADGHRSSPIVISLASDTEHDDRALARLSPTSSRGATPYEPAPMTDDDAARMRRRVGISLLGAGGSLVALGAGLHAVRVHRGERLEATSSSAPGYLPLQHDYLALRPYVIGTELAGGVVSAAGASLAVRSWEGRRAAGWIGGAVGLALASVAALEVARAPMCYGDAICPQRDVHLDRAVLLGAAAGPALSLPIAATAGATERGLRASVRIGTHVASLQLRGALR